MTFVAYKGAEKVATFNGSLRQISWNVNSLSSAEKEAISRGFDVLRLLIESVGRFAKSLMIEGGFHIRRVEASFED